MSYIDQLWRTPDGATVAAELDPAAPPAPILAEVVPWSAHDPASRRTLLRDEDWQTRFRRYDREGPGLVGASVDLPAATSTLVTLIVQELRGSDWVTCDDPALTAVLGFFRGETLSQADLFRKLIRTAGGPGEGYITTDRTPTGEWVYDIVQTPSMRDSGTGTVEIRTRPDAKRGSRWFKELSADRVQHFHVEDPEWAGLAWSPMRRALDDIEVYRRARRNMSRTLDSQLAMNGILWAKATAAASKWPDSIQAWSQRAIASDDGIEAVAPFTMATENKPEFVDIGRSTDDGLLEIADQALMSFARAMDMPTKMLMDGPGTSNHWGDYVINDAYADFTMHPRAAQACGVITVAHLRPWVAALPLTRGYNPQQLRVWFDDTRVRGKADTSSKVIELYRAGVATREAAAAAAALSPDQVFDLPEGMSEAEWWLITQSKSVCASPDEQDLEMIRPGVSAAPAGEPERPVVAGLGPFEGETASWGGLIPVTA